jgi:hypothetical protein
MGLLLIFLGAVLSCFVVHSVIVVTLVENGRSGSSFAWRYAAWGLGCPFGFAAGLLLLFELLHAGPGWILGVIVTIVFTIGSLACILSWFVVALVHCLGWSAKKKVATTQVRKAA